MPLNRRLLQSAVLSSPGTAKMLCLMQQPAVIRTGSNTTHANTSTPAIAVEEYHPSSLPAAGVPPADSLSVLLHPAPWAGYVSRCGASSSLVPLLTARVHWWSPGLGVLASRRHDQRELLSYARVLWVCSTTSTPSLQTWPRCSAVSYTTGRPSYRPGIGRRGLTSTRPTIYSPSPSGVAAPWSSQSGPVGG